MTENLKEKIGNILGVMVFLSIIFAIAYIFTFGLFFLIFWLTGAILSNYLVIILLLLAIPISFLFSLVFLFGLVHLMEAYLMEEINEEINKKKKDQS